MRLFFFYTTNNNNKQQTKQVRGAIPRTEKLDSTSPCAINSAVHVELRNSPAIFTLALDWETASPSGPDVQLIMELVSKTLNLSHVYHSVTPTTTNTSVSVFHFFYLTTFIKIYFCCQRQILHIYI